MTKKKRPHLVIQIWVVLILAYCTWQIMVLYLALREGAYMTSDKWPLLPASVPPTKMKRKKDLKIFFLKLSSYWEYAKKNKKMKWTVFTLSCYQVKIISVFYLVNFFFHSSVALISFVDTYALLGFLLWLIKYLF